MNEQKELVAFDKCAARVVEIQNIGNFIPDTSTKEGYEASKRFVLDHTTPARTDLAAAHKAAKAYWLTGGSSVDSKKNELLESLLLIQQPHQDAYKAFDQIEKDKKAKFESDLQAKIDVFHGYHQKAFNATSSDITLLIQECGETDTQEGFYHKAAEAHQARSNALDVLNDELMKAVNREVEEKAQVELAEKNRIAQVEIDKQQEVIRVQQEAMTAKQAEFDRIESEANAKAQAEADEKQRLIDEAEQAKIEKQRAIEREEHANQQASIAAEQAQLAEQQKQQKIIDDQSAADEKRANNNRHVTKIKKQAKESFIALGFSEEDAVKAVQALSHGEIKNCSINY